GRFSAEDARYVWLILGGSSVGLLAATQGRLYNSAFFALHDTRSPLRFAVIRVTLSIILGYVAAVHLPGWLDLPARWGAAGITAAAGTAAWVEYHLLQRGLSAKLGSLAPVLSDFSRIWGAALGGALAAYGALALAGGAPGPLVRAAIAFLPF